MSKQQTLFKGQLLEEKLRKYFLDLGYFVSRGVKFSFNNIEITDVDLFLYGRISSFSRERVNVDIKNKKTPQAFERILWANGLKEILNFDGCIVATTDKREVLKTFGVIHNTTILDGNFNQKLKSDPSKNRLTEEEFLLEISKFKSYNNSKGKSWKDLYEESKSRLLTELDYSGFNTTLQYINYFIEKILVDGSKREYSCRLLYILVSHSLIMLDFIIKDLAFLDQEEREKKLEDGIKFGNLGKEGIDRTISMALKITNDQRGISSIKNLFDSIPIKVLKEFFSKNENMKNLFSNARKFESLGYDRSFVQPSNLEPSQKSILSVYLDFLEIDRKSFFEKFKLPIITISKS